LHKNSISTSTGAGGGGATAPPKSFDLVKIREKSLKNSGKICGNLGKMCESLHKIAVCGLNLQKWHPNSKCRLFFKVMFFVQVRENLGRFG